jgi:hypothetical protein
MGRKEEANDPLENLHLKCVNPVLRSKMDQKVGGGRKIMQLNTLTQFLRRSKVPM